MQGLHIHTPDWHDWGVRFGHLIHDRRFWVSIALVILLGLMILAVILTDTSPGQRSFNPIYPMSPYMP